jgi:histone acetyltransferase MYST1
VHYVGTDKRLDEWVPADTVRATTPPRDSLSPGCDATQSRRVNGTTTRKRRRSSLSLVNAHDRDAHDTTQPSATLPTTMASARRNFDKVNFGLWQIKTW